MLKITENIIKYFKSTFDVDVSTIPIFFKDLDGYAGIYYGDHPGMIFVDRQALSKHSKIHGYTTIVHELTHLVQHEYRMSLSIDFKDDECADDYDYWDEDWCNKPLEVDALLSEICYLSSVERNNEDNIVAYGTVRLINTREDVLLKAINNLNGSERFTHIINRIVKQLTIVKEAAVTLM